MQGTRRARLAPPRVPAGRSVHTAEWRVTSGCCKPRGGRAHQVVPRVQLPRKLEGEPLHPAVAHGALGLVELHHVDAALDGVRQVALQGDGLWGRGRQGKTTSISRARKCRGRQLPVMPVRVCAAAHCWFCRGRAYAPRADAGRGCRSSPTPESQAAAQGPQASAQGPRVPAAHVARLGHHLGDQAHACLALVRGWCLQQVVVPAHRGGAGPLAQTGSAGSTCCNSRDAAAAAALPACRPVKLAPCMPEGWVAASPPPRPAVHAHIRLLNLPLTSAQRRS